MARFDRTRLIALASLTLASFGLVACAAAEAADSKEASPEPAKEISQPLNTQPPSGQPVSTQPLSGQSSPKAPATFTYTGELTQGGYIRGTAPSGASAVALGEVTIAVGEDGSFFAAFDRDSPGQLTLAANAQSSGIEETLTISPRKWQISRINVPKRPGGSSEAWWKKRKPEWEAITAARAIQTDAQGWRQDFVWPVKGRISGLFGRQRVYQGEPGSYHSGIDIAPGNGVPFVAPADGVVVLARTGFSLEGGLIIVDHGGGLNSAFLHASKIAVKKGEAVKQGQYLGNVGSTGRSTGPHLHWSLKWNDARLDPLLFTGPMK